MGREAWKLFGSNNYKKKYPRKHLRKDLEVVWVCGQVALLEEVEEGGVDPRLMQMHAELGEIRLIVLVPENKVAVTQEKYPKLTLREFT